MENKKESMEESIRRIVNPIFEQVAKETPKNRMSVGSAVCEAPKKVFYQPHNFRRWIDFSNDAFQPPEPHSNRGRGYGYKIINSRDHSFKNFRHCTITVRKQSVEIINKVDHKRWYAIKVSETEKVQAQIQDIVAQKEKECLEVLKHFIDEFGGSSNFNVLNRSSEDKIMGEDKIDLLPAKLRWHTEVSKKVYNEPNVEFTDSIHASTYINNRAVEEFAPVIGNGLSSMAESIKELSQSLKHQADVQNDTSSPSIDHPQPNGGASPFLDTNRMIDSLMYKPRSS